jgi:hypothetical protein
MRNVKNESAGIPKTVILGSIFLCVVGLGLLSEVTEEEAAVMEEERTTVTGENTMPALRKVKNQVPAVAAVAAVAAVTAVQPASPAVSGDVYLDDLKETSSKGEDEVHCFISANT